MKNVPEGERPRRHARQLVRGLHGGDGAGQPAPGAEGGGADEPDGRRLDGRRLVPLRRLPPAQLRLLRRAERRTRRRQHDHPPRHRRLRELPPRRLGRRLREGQRARPAADVAQGGGASGLRPVLAGAGARQDHGQAAAHRPDDVDPGHLGPGGHVGRDPELPGGGAEGHRQHPQLPGDGAVAAQRRQLRGLDARAAEVRGRHRAAVPPRRAEAVLRSVPEAGRTEGRHAGRLHLQHRREPLGPLPALAAVVRHRLPVDRQAAVFHRQLRPVVHGAGSGQRERRQRLRRVRLRSGQAGALPAAAGALLRWRRLAALAALAISGWWPIAPTCSPT